MVRVLANVNSSKLAAMSLIWLDLYRSAATTIPIILMNWQFYVYMTIYVEALKQLYILNNNNNN